MEFITAEYITNVLLFSLLFLTAIVSFVACLKMSDDISMITKDTEFYDFEMKTNVGQRLKFATFCFSIEVSLIVMAIVYLCTSPLPFMDKALVIKEFPIVSVFFFSLGATMLYFRNPVLRLYPIKPSRIYVGQIARIRTYKKTTKIIRDLAFPLLITLTLFPYLFGFVLLHLIIKDANERTFFEVVMGEKFYKTYSMVSPKWIDTHL